MEKEKPKSYGARSLIIRDNEILLIKHTLQKAAWQGWHTVGGGVDEGENHLEAVNRELYEEVGIIHTAKPKLFGYYFNPKEDRDDYVYLYVSTEFNKEAVKCDEIAKEKWFPLNKLPDDIQVNARHRIEEYMGVRPRSYQW